MIFKEFVMRFARYIKPYWWQSSIVFAFMVLTIATSLAFPYILMILIDEALPDEDYYLLGILLATLFGIIALNIISAFIVNYLYLWVGNRVVFKMRSELFSHLLRLPLDFFKRNKTGDIAHRLNNDVQIIQKTLHLVLYRVLRPCCHPRLGRASSHTGNDRFGSANRLFPVLHAHFRPLGKPEPIVSRLRTGVGFPAADCGIHGRADGD